MDLTYTHKTVMNLSAYYFSKSYGFQYMIPHNYNVTYVGIMKPMITYV